MPTTIAIICTLDELIPYSLADRENRYFSLHLSVAFKNQALLPETALLPFFQPWTLAAVTPVIYADAGAAGTAPSGALIAAADLVFIDPTPIDPTQIGEWLGKRLTTAITNQTGSYFNWADDPDPSLTLPADPEENWSRIVSHASTYMAPIPNSLKLAFHFKIDATKLAANPRLFAALALQVNNTTTYSPANVPNTPNKGYASWQYTSAPGTAGTYAITSYHAEFIPAPLPAALPKPHFIDLNTFWIGTENGQDQIQTPPPEASASEDWRTALEFRAAEEFDLGQRMIVVLRQLFFPPQPPPSPGTPPPDPYHPIDASHPTFAEVDTIKTAILAALRDTADLGLRYGPDGINLLRFVLQKTPTPPAAAPYEAALIQATPMSSTDWPTEVSKATGVSTKVTATRGADAAPSTGDYVRATLDMLDNVQKALATGTVLATAIFDQWDKILTPTVPDWTDKTKNISGAVSTVLADLSTSRALRSRMLLANMGGVAQTTSTTDPKHPANPATPIWSALIATTTGAASTYLSETTDITTNLQNLLQSYFRGRFGITVADTNAVLFANRAPQAAWPGTAAAPSPDLAAALSADAGTFASSVLFPSTAGHGAPTPQTPTPASHPIIIQVGETSDPTQPLNQDAERKVAGLGLLIREGTGAWSCANIANLYVAQFQTQTFQKLLDSLPVPLRLSRRNGLKQAVLAYDSASLVNQDPDDAGSKDFDTDWATYPLPGDQDWSQIFQYRLDAQQLVGLPQLTTDNQGNFKLQIPTYQPPLDTLRDWKRIPALKFGKTYTLLPFVIGNGGALPVQLASLTNPFTPVVPSAFNTAWQQANLVGYQRAVTYKRRVSVGVPRVVQPVTGTSAISTLALPVFPATVVPLARDFMPHSSTPPPLMLLWGDPTQKTPGTIPSFQFQLRPPSCDLETWDRWVAGLTESAADTQAGNTYRNTRVAVKTAVGQATLKTVAATQPPSGQPTPAAPDLSIDDPAVISLTLSLNPIYPSSTLTAPQTQTIPLTPPPAIASTITGSAAAVVQVLMSYVQSNQFTVSCTIGNAANISTLNNGAIAITVPQGQVWQLNIQANLNAADIQNKFEGPAATAAGSVFSLIIEAATAGIFAPGTSAATILPFQQALWNGLSVGYDQQKQTLNATLQSWADPAPNQPDLSRDLLRTVNLRRQDWRWMGRPLPPLPTDWNAPTAALLDADPLATATGAMNSRLWEIASFAERSDDDSAITSTSINFTNGSAPPLVTLLSADLSQAPRAQYFRFGIDAHSRYEGLPGLPLAAIRAQRNNAADTSAYTRWRRWVKPPAVAAPIPKPKVLMVIPLTSPDASDKTTVLPDLLAIANEPWFTLAGLSEELHAELDLARDPSFPLSVSTAQANPIPELGPNPILSAQSLESSDLKFTTGAAIPAQPLGTTFDLDTTAPLFGNTCFRVRPSMLWSSAGIFSGTLPPSGLEHFTARVRFKRVICGTAFGLPVDPQPSDLTDPFLVEFQSSFDHCFVTNPATAATSLQKFKDLTFSIANGAIQFAYAGAPVTLQPGPPQNPHLELWALVMNLVADATGQVQDQTFAADLVSLTTPTTAPVSSAMGIYILEVLCTEGYQGTFTSGISNAAAMLFGNPADPNRLLSDVKARIQRCSPMISNGTLGS